MSVHVVQGERDLVADCRSLAHFELRGIPPMVAAAARIAVTFRIDADGLLTVEAEEKTTHVRAGVEVQPSYGLKETDIEKMLNDSVQHGRADHDKRRLKERQLEARRILETLQASLQMDGKILLDEQEYQTLERAQDDLRKALEGTDPEHIRTQLEHLEQCSETYIKRRINRDIEAAVHSRSVEDL